MEGDRGVCVHASTVLHCTWRTLYSVFILIRKQYLGGIMTLNTANQTDFGRLSPIGTPGTGLSSYSVYVEAE